jgi:hypothetical protein
MIYAWLPAVCAGSGHSSIAMGSGRSEVDLSGVRRWRAAACHQAVRLLGELVVDLGEAVLCG